MDSVHEIAMISLANIYLQNRRVISLVELSTCSSTVFHPLTIFLAARLAVMAVSRRPRRKRVRCACV